MSLNFDTDPVLLIDAENVFNYINRKVILHNFKLICSIIATYIINCYATPSRLFIAGGGEINPLIKYLFEFISLNEMNAKEVVFADGSSVAGSLNSIKDYWDKLIGVGPKYGHFPKPTKSYLIVKEKN